MAPYFSIILPIYNVAPYLRRCVQSVCAQSFEDYELILVDDGSTDESGNICDQLAGENSRVTVIHKPNGGLSSARNAGAEVAGGQYIWFVDSDDWIREDALELLHGASCQEKPDMVKFDYVRVDPGHRPQRSGEKTGIREGKSFLEQALCRPGRFGLSAWSYLYRREFLRTQQLRFVSERIVCSEDYLFNLEALLLAQKVCVLDQALYYYELRQGSLTQCYKKEQPQRYARLYEHLRAAYKRAGQLEVWQGRLSLFYLWHLLHGTCMSNEYQVAGDHTLAQGRENVRRFLAEESCRQALRLCDMSGMGWKQKLQLHAMRWQCEPLFYRLFVKKGKLR